MSLGLPVALLAGGLATRLRPITETVPKAMVPVAGQPFIAHQLRLLADNGVTRVVLCLGHLGHQVEDFVGDGASFGLAVDYAHDGPVLLGTGGALRAALPRLGDAFLVMYGDSYLPTPFAPPARAFLDSGKGGLMTVFRNEGRWDSSNVEFSAGKIAVYDKRNKTSAMHHIDYGLGGVLARVLARKPEGAAFDLADLYAELLAKDDLLGFEVFDRFYEIGSPAGLAETSALLAGGRR